MNHLAPPVPLGAESLLSSLREIVGENHVVLGSDDPGALVDQRRLYFGRAQAVARPGSTEEAARLVRFLAERRIKIVPQGGNTGLVGGATPDESGESVVIQTSRLNRIRAIDLDNDTITVEAGVTLAAVHQAAEDHERMFPLSLPSEGTCTIGGNLAANAGGTQVLRYGNMRALVLGIEVVLPDGEIWDGLRGLRKDNTGYDLKDLFIGSEGTLGLITAATLRLLPPPIANRTAFVKLDRVEDALRLLRAAREGLGSGLTGFELISKASYDLVSDLVPEQILPFTPEPESPDRWYALIELSDEESDDHAALAMERVLSAALEDGLIKDALIAASLQQIRTIWDLREHSIATSQTLDGYKIKFDVSVPISSIPAFLAQTETALHARFPGLRIFVHGHAGDGNLHYNVARSVNGSDDDVIRNKQEISKLVHDQVHALAGSISAEHGVGRSKIDELPRYKNSLELALMHKIKNAFDPDGVMNPGKLLQGELA